MKTLSTVSTYYLILELMDGGHTGLLPELEPIDEKEIFAELERRTNINFGDSKDEWAKWFLGNEEHGSEMERANFFLFMDAKKSRLRAYKDLLAKEK